MSSPTDFKFFRFHLAKEGFNFLGKGLNFILKILRGANAVEGWIFRTENRGQTGRQLWKTFI